MTEPSSNQFPEEKTIDIEHKDGLLEELNLPPHVIKFIRENARALQIAAACVVLLVLGWSYYDYYSQAKANNASAALNAAVQLEDETARAEALQKVADEYSGTDAALWSRIEEGHIAYKGEDYEKALRIYQQVFNDLGGDSPLKPLLAYNIGLAYENGGQADKALGFYTKLAGYSGFEVKGLMAEGRIYEMRDENEEALRVYQEAAASEEVTPLDKSILTEKINTLKEPGTETQETEETEAS